jgi:N-acetyl-gamma-glutamyl-phosphate reductase
VYGLTEHARDAIAAARLVANPGCYPTSVLLAVKPLLANGLVAPASTIVADCKSGTSGAGKNPSERTHFANVHENFCAYGVGDHRHAPEIETHAALKDGVRIAFVPHLLPVFRGILSTIYVEPRTGVDAGAMRDALRKAYAGEPFVRVYDKGVPELRNVQLTNECHIAVANVANRVVIVSAIDNLVKGASGQALQNMNLVLGCEETAGLS